MGDIFNPEGSGYDEIAADSLREIRPLIGEKPNYDGKSPNDYVTSGEGESQSLDWYKHSSSLDPSTGRLLKGMDHPTIDKTIDMEEKRGYSFIKEDDGRYYSKPTGYRKSFEKIIKNAPSELARVATKQDGPSHYGLYTFEGEDGERRFVSSTSDEWHKPREFSVDDWMYRNARKKMDAGKTFPMDTDSGVSGWGTYKDLVEPTLQEKIIEKIMGK